VSAEHGRVATTDSARASGSPPQDRPVQAHLLRAGTLGVAAAGVYVAITAVVRAAGLPVAALVRNTGVARSLHVHSTRRPCSRTASR
jgi:hypothetical protein